MSPESASIKLFPINRIVAKTAGLPRALPEVKMLRPLRVLMVLVGGAVLLLLIRGLAKTLTVGDEFPSQYTLAVWEWRSPLGANRAQTEAALKLLQSKGVDTIFLNVNDYLDIYELPQSKEREKRLQEFDEAVSAYHELARDHNMEVYAGAGNTTWAHSSHHYLGELVLSYARWYNQTHPDHQFAGIQFDVEAQNLPSFSKAPEPLLRDYLDLLDMLVQKTDGDPVLKDLKIGVTMPFWFDGENPVINHVSWNGKNKLPYQHIIDIIGRLRHPQIIVMAYRVDAQGSGGSIAHSKTEVKYANHTNVRILIGQEVSKVQPEKITFWNKGESVFRGAISQLAHAFGSDDSFAGIAINDLSSYEQLVLNHR